MNILTRYFSYYLDSFQGTCTSDVDTKYDQFLKILKQNPRQVIHLCKCDCTRLRFPNLPPTMFAKLAFRAWEQLYPVLPLLRSSQVKTWYLFIDFLFRCTPDNKVSELEPLLHRCLHLQNRKELSFDRRHDYGSFFNFKYYSPQMQLWLILHGYDRTSVWDSTRLSVEWAIQNWKQITSLTNRLSPAKAKQIYYEMLRIRVERTGYDFFPNYYDFKKFDLATVIDEFLKLYPDFSVGSTFYVDRMISTYSLSEVAEILYISQRLPVFFLPQDIDAINQVAATWTKHELMAALS